ncbi:MAG: FAD binding domain-containing protein [Pseudomonadota bacterium]
MKPFDYMRPKDLEEASAAWAAHGSSARLLAGGTDLTVGLRHGAIQTDLVIDLKEVVELTSDISEFSGHLRIAAGTTMTEIKDYLGAKSLFPALQDATAVVGSIQIRNRATLAGNICNASPAADTVPVLAALDASVEIFGPDGLRYKKVATFIEGNRQIDLNAGELVAAVHIPLPLGTHGCAFDRITRRRGVDLATTNLGCVVTGEGKVSLAFGAVSPRPLVLTDETGILGDPKATPHDRAPVIAELASEARPISDVRAQADYRAAMLCVMAERSLLAAHARLAWSAANA